MMFGFGFLMMLGFILILLAFIGLCMALVVWLNQQSGKKG